MKQIADAISSLVPLQYQSKPISQRKVTRKKVGTRTIAGFTAVGYQFFVDGNIEETVWVSDDARLSGLIKNSMTMENEMKKSPACKTMEENASDLQSAKLYKETTKGRLVMDDGYKKVVKVEQKRIPANTFLPPSGYRKFTSYEQYEKYIKSHQQTRKQPSSGRVKTPDSALPEASSVESGEKQPPASREPATTDDADQGMEMPDMDALKQGVDDILRSIW